jgi:hypothetical protein
MRKRQGKEGQRPGATSKRSNCKGPSRVTVCSHSQRDMAASDLTTQNVRIINRDGLSIRQTL